MPSYQSSPQPDVIVLGGGVIGWACAYYFTRLACECSSSMLALAVLPRICRSRIRGLQARN